MRKAWVLFSLGLVCAVAAPASALQLRYRFRPGATTRYRVMVAAGALSQSPAAPHPMKMQFTLDAHAVQKVLSVSRTGVAEIEFVNTAGTMKTTSQGRTSTSPVAREVARMKLTERGKLLSYHTQPSGEEAASIATSRAPAGGPRLGADPAASDVVGGAGAELRQADPLRALAGLNFPDRDLKPGDHWRSESRIDLGNGRTMVMRIASRFLSVIDYKGRKCARISTRFEMPMDTAGLDGDNRALAMNARGKLAGQITTLFDYVAGQELYVDGSVSMLFKLQMSAADAAESGPSIDMTSAMKLNVRQVRVD
jgi:hypothetical protein